MTLTRAPLQSFQSTIASASVHHCAERRPSPGVRFPIRDVDPRDAGRSGRPASFRKPFSSISHVLIALQDVFERIAASLPLQRPSWRWSPALLPKKARDSPGVLRLSNTFVDDESGSGAHRSRHLQGLDTLLAACSSSSYPPEGGSVSEVFLQRFPPSPIGSSSPRSYPPAVRWNVIKQPPSTSGFRSR
jgi:hypothetical protein